MCITVKESCPTPNSPEQKSWESDKKQTCTSCKLWVQGCWFSCAQLHASCIRDQNLWALQFASFLFSSPALVSARRSLNLDSEENKIPGYTKAALIQSEYSHSCVYLIIRKGTKTPLYTLKACFNTLCIRNHALTLLSRGLSMSGKFFLCSYYLSI